jgi:hypothetical protein
MLARLALCVGGFISLVVPLTARAQVAQPQPYPYPPQPYPYPPPQPYPYPPPQPGYAPAYPDPYRMQAAYAEYESRKKNEGLAVILEVVLPGGGSIYAGHVEGALVTWGCTAVGGLLLILWATSYVDRHHSDDRISHRRDWALVAGLGLAVGGRVYGLYDSFASSRRFNVELQRRLGLPGHVSLGIGPIVGPGGTAWGPRLALEL